MLISLLKPTSIFCFVLFSVNAFAQSADVYLIKPTTGSVSLDSSRYEVKEIKEVKEVKVVKAPVKKASKEVEPKPAEEQKPAVAPTTDSKSQLSKTNDDSDDKDSGKRPWTEVDPRFNFVQLSLSTGLLYVDSESASWFRNYYSSAPVIAVNTEFWIHPSLSLSAGYMNTIAADITAEPTSSRKLEVDHRQYDIGLMFRKYASNNRKASSISAGLVYQDNQMAMDSTETNRVQLKTKGVGLTLKARMPQSSKRAITLSTTFRPNLKIEEGKTASTYKSGELDASSSWNFQFRYEHLLNRRNVYFWSLEHQIDKSVYKGSTNISDPITGSTLDGISVKAGRSLINFGITWGD